MIQCIKVDEVVDVLVDILVEVATDEELAAETTIVEEAMAEALEPHLLMELTYLIPIACFLILNGTILAKKGRTMF